MNQLVPLAIALSVLIACAPGKDTADTGSEAITADQLAAAQSDILAQIGDASCASEEDCRTVAFGAKPCGGPWEYLAYCVSGLDEPALLDAIDDYNQLEQAYNLQEDLASTCAAIGDPGPAYVDGVCELALPT